MRRRNRLLSALFAVVAAGLLNGVLGAPSAAAAPTEVTEIAFTQAVDGGATARVEVSFDRAVASAVAAKVRDSMNATRVVEGQTVERLACQQDLTRSDRNGVWGLRYACLPAYAVLSWHYRLSPAAQATAVGVVDERGLSWWRNGIRQAQNAGHPGAPADYRFHGTMKKVWNGDVVDYQDYTVGVKSNETVDLKKLAVEPAG